MKKTISTILPIVALSSVMVAPSFAAIETLGRPSCGAWVTERQKMSAAGTTYRFWLIGYLSGLAVGSSMDFLRGIDNDSIYLWTDNYCKASPLKYLDEAGRELAMELVKQKNL